ncbi:MAG: hypothetical protein FWG72_02515 [Oscillospiraceae bacterium]|nr:hypothetical protein [Oscillospiraceae bacterium]
MNWVCKCGCRHYGAYSSDRGSRCKECGSISPESYSNVNEDERELDFNILRDLSTSKDDKFITSANAVVRSIPPLGFWKWFRILPHEEWIKLGYSFKAYRGVDYFGDASGNIEVFYNNEMLKKYDDINLRDLDNFERSIYVKPL